ncbi:MAG TPA: MFS transporter [Candidatus Binatia bacterium]|nr:MFS transporter [Candidatus Binatia bacterium]
MAQSAVAQPKAADWNLSGLFAVGLGHFVDDLFSGTVAFTIFYVVSNAHLPAWYQGLLSFFWYLTSSIVQPLAGAYTDRNGRWWFMPTAILIVVVTLSLAGLATSIWVLAIFIVCGGFGAAVMHPEGGKYASMLSGTRRSQGISLFQIGGTLGLSLGPVTIATLLTHFGRHGSLLMLIPGLLAVAYLYYAIHRAARDAQSAHSARTRNAQADDRPVDRLGIGLVVTSTTIRFFAVTAFVTYLPNLLTARGLSLLEAGQIVTVFMLLGNIGLYLGGYLGDRLGSVVASILALVLSVPCLVGFFFAPMPLAFGLLFLGNVLMTMQNAPSVVLVQTMLPKNLGMALGLINGVSFGAGSVLVTALGFAVTRFGPSEALLYASISPLIAASAYFTINRRLRGLLQQV